MKFLSIIVLSLYLVACGGGSVDSVETEKPVEPVKPLDPVETEEPEESEDPIDEIPSVNSNFGDVSFQSFEALQDKAIELSDQAYKGGIESPADITKDNALNFIGIFLFETQILPKPDNTISSVLNNKTKVLNASPFNQNNIINNLKPAAFIVDETQLCDDGGTRRFAGQLNDDGIGALGIEYANCKQNNAILDGKGAIYYHEANYNRATYFYDSLKTNVNGVPFVITGFVSPNANGALLNLTVEHSSQNFTHKLKDFYINNIENEFESNGVIFHSEYGNVNFESENISKISGQSYFSKGNVVFKGQNDDTLVLGFVDKIFEIRLDSQGDDMIDYIAVESQYNGLTKDIEFVGEFIAFENFSYPPSYNDFKFVSNNYDTTTPIEVNVVGITDPEQDLIKIKYEWEINSIILQDQTFNILPAFIAQKNDSVSVSAIISDGINEIPTNKINIIVGDAPGSLTIPDFPISVNSEEEVNFFVEVVDPDIIDFELSNLHIISAPDGVSFVDGNVKWDAAKPIFNGSTYFITFSAIVNGNERLETVELIVNNPDGDLPIARSGIKVPTNNYSTWIGQFDNVGKNQILLTDNKNGILTLEHSGDTYIQNWMYPYGLDSGSITKSNAEILQVLKVDINNDGQNEIIIATRDDVFLIKDKKSIAQKLFNTDFNGYIVSIAASDTNGDGVEELAILLDKRLVLFDIVNTTEIFSVNLTALPDDSTPSLVSILIGNVDNDSDKEIILSSGYVYDATSGVNKWFYPSGFGNHMALADVDNNGVQEIFASSFTGDPSLFSGVDKKLLWSVENLNNICSLNAGNLDDDPSSELLVGDCQFGDLKVYDATLSGPELKFSVDDHDGGVKGIAVGDVNSDGRNDILWSTSIGSTKENSLAMVLMEEQGYTFLQNKNPSQLVNFAAAGIAEVVPDQFKAIYVSPDTEGDNFGHRIVQMDFDGSYEISEISDANSQMGNLAELTDFDKDGYSELFYTTANLNDHELVGVNLEDLNIQWSTGAGILQQRVDTLNIADINQDGFDDLIYGFNQQINIVNLNDQSLIDVILLDSKIYDVAIEKQPEGKPRLAVSTGDNLSIFEQNESGSYDITNSVDYGFTTFDQIEFQDVDGIKGSEIVVLEIYNLSIGLNTSFIHIFDDSLIERKKLIVPYAFVTTFQIEEGDVYPKNLLISANNREKYRQNGTRNKITMQLISYDSGRAIWRSPFLLEDVTENSLYYYTDQLGEKQLTFASRNAMYLTK